MKRALVLTVAVLLLAGLWLLSGLGGEESGGGVAGPQRSAPGPQGETSLELDPARTGEGVAQGAREEASAAPAAILEPAPPLGSVRLIVEGLRPGSTARVTHTRGEVTQTAELEATRDDPSPSVLLERRGGGDPSEPVLGREWIRVEAEGYCTRGLPLDPEAEVDEVVATMVPDQALLLEFPGLAGHPGSFEVSLEWSDPPEASQYSGIEVPFVFMDERVPLDASGSASVRGLLVPSSVTLSLLSLPRTPGLPGVVIYRCSLRVEAGRGSLAWPDLRVHEVSLQAPEAGRPFEVHYRPSLNSSLHLPDGARHFGWTNPYGMHEQVRLRSDASGRLELLLPPTTRTVPTLRYLEDEEAEEDEGWEELAPMVVDGPGPISLGG